MVKNKWKSGEKNRLKCFDFWPQGAIIPLQKRKIAHFMQNYLPFYTIWQNSIKCTVIRQIADSISYNCKFF